MVLKRILDAFGEISCLSKVMKRGLKINYSISLRLPFTVEKKQKLFKKYDLLTSIKCEIS